MTCTYTTLHDHVLFVFCSKIGEEQSAEDAEDGPPELLVCYRCKKKSILTDKAMFFSFNKVH